MEMIKIIWDLSTQAVDMAYSKNYTVKDIIFDRRMILTIDHMSVRHM